MCWLYGAGFKWQRQLVFRSKLTMHTAFERKDNKDPAAVTAVNISRYVDGRLLWSQTFLCWSKIDTTFFHWELLSVPLSYNSAQNKP